MIALHHDVWIAETLQFLSCPVVFLRSSEVGYIAKMYHKVDGIALIDVIYLCNKVLIPLVRVAYHSYSKRIFVLTERFYLGYILRIYVYLSLHPRIIRMHIKHCITRCQSQQGERYS